MTRTFWERKVTTQEHYDAAGNLTGKTVVTEETDREEDEILDELEEGCLCVDCDNDGCECCGEDPDECLCTECDMVDACECKCETGIIATETCDPCEVCDECCCGGCEVDEIREDDAIKAAIAEMAAKRPVEQEVPRMVIIAGEGLGGLREALTKLGVR